MKTFASIAVPILVGSVLLMLALSGLRRGRIWSKLREWNRDESPLVYWLLVLLYVVMGGGMLLIGIASILAAAGVIPPP